MLEGVSEGCQRLMAFAPSQRLKRLQPIPAGSDDASLAHSVLKRLRLHHDQHVQQQCGNPLLNGSHSSPATPCGGTAASATGCTSSACEQATAVDGASPGTALSPTQARAGVTFPYSRGRPATTPQQPLATIVEVHEDLHLQLQQQRAQHAGPVASERSRRPRSIDEPAKPATAAGTSSHDRGGDSFAGALSMRRASELPRKQRRRVSRTTSRQALTQPVSDVMVLPEPAPDIRPELPRRQQQRNRGALLPRVPPEALMRRHPHASSSSSGGADSGGSSGARSESSPSASSGAHLHTTPQRSSEADEAMADDDGGEVITGPPASTPAVSAGATAGTAPVADSDVMEE